MLEHNPYIILHHQNNVSIAFPMSGNLGLDTMILIIPVILAKIHGFWFSTFRRKRASEYHYKSSISEKRPRVPAWHPLDSDSTGYHDIKSIKTHCGTFTARLDKKSGFGCRTIGRNHPQVHPHMRAKFAYT